MMQECEVPGALRDRLVELGIEATLEVLVEVEGRYPIYGVTCAGERAVEVWEVLREAVEATGLWPVIVGAVSEFNFHRDAIESADEGAEAALGVEAILAASEAVTAFHRFDEARRREPQPLVAGPEGVLERWMRSYPWGAPLETLREALGEARATTVVPGTRRWEEDGDWPTDVEPAQGYVVPISLLSGEPLKRALVALVPTRHGWQVPAFFKFGDWNECPAPHQHVGLLRYWGERYGAELVSLGHDVLEMRVGVVVINRQQAYELAREQEASCQDIVAQGTGDVLTLAASLVRATSWYFWWD